MEGGGRVVEVGSVKRTRWRTRFGFWVEWRARRIERVGLGGLSSFALPRMVMLPSSEGWPPPWGWKIVSSVVRMKSWSGSGSAALKRLRLASDRSVRRLEDVTLVLNVRIEASCW